MDNWVICPKCLDATQAEVGAPCAECGTPQVATPLYPSKSIVELDPEVWG